MKRVVERASLADLVGRPALLWVWLPLFAVSVAHYTTETAVHWPHDVFRRLYYVPIVVAAFLFGRRGSMAAAVIASAVYLPHAFLHMGHLDPGGAVEKILEIVLYNVMGFITGTLADREHAERRRQERLAAELQRTLEDKRDMEAHLVRAGRLQALGELTAGLAHEIKNPLASMKGAAEIIADEIPADSPRAEMVVILRREVDRLSALLERFLSFARPKDVHLEPVSLCDIIDDTIQLAALREDRQRIDWQRSGSHMMVMGDRAQLAQVLLNIVLNAFEASPEGAAVRIACGRAGDERRPLAFVRVSDAGPGIPAEHRERVFDPFFTTSPKGTGLGLSIASRIVDEHGGTIELIDSDSGTTVEVRLPLEATTSHTP